MKVRWLVLMILIVGAAVGVVLWLGQGQGPVEPTSHQLDSTSSVDDNQPIRIGLIPERDIFEQRRRYVALTEELSKRLGRPIELVTQNSYEGILADFETDQVDAAFLGSFITVLAMDRFGAKVLVKPEVEEGVTTYRGVILVRDDGPVMAIEDLAGRSIAMVRATTAGSLFPIAEFNTRGMLDRDPIPEFQWVGTHDAAVRALLAGRVDAAAAKDSRVRHFESLPNTPPLRWLATSEVVPNNALVVRAGLNIEVAEQMAQILLAMSEDEEGRAALGRSGANRFVPCDVAEYSAVIRMSETIGQHWRDGGVPGPAPDAGVIGSHLGRRE